MANIKQHLLEVIRVDAAGIADALRCIFHSIVFNRMLGQVTPKEETTNVGFTYVRVDHPEVVERVNAAVDQVVAKVKAATVSHKLVLTLKHVTKGLIFSRTYDWEQWIVSVKLVSSPQSTEERALLAESLRNQLNRTMFFIMSKVNVEQDHIPTENIDPEAAIPFPVTIEPVAKARSSSWLPWFNVMSASVAE